MSIRCSRKVPCLCQHSDAPTERRIVIREGRLGSMEARSLRRKGLTEVKRVWRYSLELDEEEFDMVINSLMSW